jgi:hypothetical protein
MLALTGILVNFHIHSFICRPLDQLKSTVFTIWHTCFSLLKLSVLLPFCFTKHFILIFGSTNFFIYRTCLQNLYVHKISVWLKNTTSTGSKRSRDSAVGIATGYELDVRVVRVLVLVGLRIFSSPRRSDRLWGPPDLLYSGYQGLFLWGVKWPGVKLTTHLQLVPRSRKCGSIHPFPPYAFMA